MFTNMTGQYKEREVANMTADYNTSYSAATDGLSDVERFVKSQIEEWGFEYVESMFLNNCEPRLIDGRWVWYVPSDLLSIHGDSNSISCDLHNPSNSFRVLASSVA